MTNILKLRTPALNSITFSNSSRTHFEVCRCVCERAMCVVKRWFFAWKISYRIASSRFVLFLACPVRTYIRWSSDCLHPGKWLFLSLLTLPHSIASPMLESFAQTTTRYIYLEIYSYTIRFSGSGKQFELIVNENQCDAEKGSFKCAQEQTVAE